MKNYNGEVYGGLIDLAYIDKNSISQAIIDIYDFNFRSVTGKLFRKTIIYEYNLHFKADLRWGEDTIVVLDFVFHCNNLIFYPKALYNYNQYLYGLTDTRHYEDEISLLNELIRKAKQFDSQQGPLYYIMANKFGYYHFENILKCYVFAESRWGISRERLIEIKKIESVKILINNRFIKGGRRAAVFNLLLRKNLISLSICFAKLMNYISKPLY